MMIYKVGKQIVVLGLGSNLGDKIINISAATRFLSRLGSVIYKGRLYKSKAMDMNEGSPDFINTVIAIRTTASPVYFFTEIKKIERHMGRRVFYERGSNRIIDIDILFWGRRRIKSHHICVPHNGIRCRDFVVVPLQDLNRCIKGVVPKMYEGLLRYSSRSLELAVPE